MSEATFTIQSESDSESDRSVAARELVSAICTQSPGSAVTGERSNKAGQNLIDIVLIACTHLTVMGIIEGIRFAWENLREPLKIRSPLGGEYTFRGNTQELKVFMTNVVGVEQNVGSPGENRG